jgi:Uma2 family endonuclease
VEIVSPSTKRIDRTIKPPMHAEADIPWYWRLEPEQHQLIGYQLRNYEYIEVQRISSGPDTAVANPFGLIVMDPSKLVKQR